MADLSDQRIAQGCGHSIVDEPREAHGEEARLQAAMVEDGPW